MPAGEDTSGIFTKKNGENKLEVAAAPVVNVSRGAADCDPATLVAVIKQRNAVYGRER